MLKIRIIPILTFNGFALVKTKQFKNPRMVGNPVQAARIFNARGVDELVFLDIFASNQKRKINLKVVSEVINQCFMPLAIGGGISSLEDISDLLKIGADKVVIKNSAIKNPDFIKEAVDFFGSQCISVAVDVFKSQGGEYMVLNDDHRSINLSTFINDMETCGVGEYVLTNTEKDGTMQGFDIGLVNEVKHLTNKPIIAVGGAGNPTHFLDLFTQTEVGAAGASSIFHFTQYTPQDVKKLLRENNISVRL